MDWMTYFENVEEAYGRAGLERAALVALKRYPKEMFRIRSTLPFSWDVWDYMSDQDLDGPPLYALANEMTDELSDLYDKVHKTMMEIDSSMVEGYFHCQSGSQTFLKQNGYVTEV